MPSSLNSSLVNWDCGQRGMHLGMVIEPHYWPGGLLGGTPPLCHRGHAKLVSLGSQGFSCDDSSDLGEVVGEHHGWFSNGIRFPSPLTMHSLVAFLDQPLWDKPKRYGLEHRTA